MTAGRKINTQSTHWNTPPKYVDAVRKVFGDISLDPCSNDGSIVNAKKNEFFDGLSLDWSMYRTIFVNPPYGRGIYDWLKKCKECERDVIALIPVATNTRHWKEFVFKSKVICFLGDTRLKFMINGTTDNKGASMACAMIYWGGNPDKFAREFNKHGVCLSLYNKLLS